MSALMTEMQPQPQAAMSTQQSSSTDAVTAKPADVESQEMPKKEPSLWMRGGGCIGAWYGYFFSSSSLEQSY